MELNQADMLERVHRYRCTRISAKSSGNNIAEI